MEFQNNYPIYLQIADDIKRRIVIGELHPGDKLPSNTDLAVAPIRYSEFTDNWKWKASLSLAEAWGRS
mgnify:CR=1 FL=1